MRIADLELAQHGLDSLGAVKPEVGNAEFTVVGYSTRGRRMVGRVMKRSADQPSLAVQEFRERFVSPAWADLDLWSLGVRDDRASVVKLLKHQWRLARERAPEFSSGGRLFIAEGRRCRISIEQACVLLAR